MSSPQDMDWCRGSSWLQEHGMRRINGNISFVVTSVLEALKYQLEKHNMEVVVGKHWVSHDCQP